MVFSGVGGKLTSLFKRLRLKDLKGETAENRHRIRNADQCGIYRLVHRYSTQRVGNACHQIAFLLRNRILSHILQLSRIPSESVESVQDDVAQEAGTLCYLHSVPGVLC